MSPTAANQLSVLQPSNDGTSATEENRFSIEAESRNDLGRAGRARAEIEVLARTLSDAIGVGGRERRSGSAAERARLVVTRAIKASLRKIERGHPALGHLLGITIRTGTFCSYRPDPRSAVAWML